MQDKDRFSEEISNSVVRLPNELSFSATQNDFILRILKLRSSERPLSRQICVHPWLDGAFDEEMTPPSSLDNPSTPKAMSTRAEMLSPSLGSISSPAMAANSLAIKDMVISQRERHMLEVDTEKTGHQLHLPPLEPSTPSIGRARKFLNSELSGKKILPSEFFGTGSTASSESAPTMLKSMSDLVVRNSDGSEVMAESTPPRAASSVTRTSLTPENSRRRLQSNLHVVTEYGAEGPQGTGRSSNDEELTAIDQYANN